MEGVAVMLDVGEEDVPAVGPDKIPIGEVGKVLASGAAGSVSERTGGGERVTCEGNLGVADV